MSRLVQLGRTIGLPFAKFGGWYNKTAERNPLTTGIVTTVIKTSAADLFAQKVVERRETVDWKRHNMFCVFGFFYLGGFQYYLYNHLFVRWCKHLTAAVGHVGAAPLKVLIDQGLHHPLIYFPTFYALKGYVEGRPLQSTYEAYRTDLWENCKALWTIWVPAQLVNFAVVPRHLRIPFVAGVSFCWTVVISVMRGTLQQASSHEMSPQASTTLGKDSALELQAPSEYPFAATTSRVPLAFFASGDHTRATGLQQPDQGLKSLFSDAKP